MKLVKWIIKSIFFGLLIIFVINFIGSFININIPINVWTIIIVSLLRLPGAIVLSILFLI